jgi:hypothetical protein
MEQQLSLTGGSNPKSATEHHMWDKPPRVQSDELSEEEIDLNYVFPSIAT